MKSIRLALVAFGVLLTCAVPSVYAGTLDPAVQAAVSGGVSGSVPVIVRFQQGVDFTALEQEAWQTALALYPNDAESARREWRKVMRRLLVDALQNEALGSLDSVRTLLGKFGVNLPLRLLWARNSVAGRVPAKVLPLIAALPGVDSVSMDITLQGPGDGTAPTAPSYWNLPATGVEQVWATGNTGQDIVVATLDTGVDATHPDLAPRWRGGSNSWFDPNGQHATPADVNGHGTQVMGLLVGGDALGYQVGMAPGAQWIAAKIFDDANQSTLSAIHEAYQWLLDPDGDPATDDAPDVVNNSWALETTIGQCNQEFQPDIALLKLAEIVVTFAAGNYGPAANTSVSPGNDPAVVSVGAIDNQFNIDVQSSRGAGACDGGTYPRLVAPGSDVLTDDLVPNYYNVVSGTSFAVAHLSGAMAVLKSAFPTATVTQLETALVETATDLGPAGPDNTYGNGMINVAAAYDWLVANLGGGGGAPGELALSAATYSVDENVATLNITVTRSGGSTGAVSVDYATSDGIAIAGQDYQAASGTLNLADGETSASITITILDDTVYEGDETFGIALSNPQGGATLGAQSSASVVIVDNEAAPQPGTLSLAAGSYSVAEDGGSVQITVVRGGGSDGAVTVNYATGDGSAQAGSDYTQTAGTLTLADGQASAVFSVAIIDDTDYEGDENFSVTLSGAGGGATLGSPASATVTIVDNDAPSGPVDGDGDGYASDVDCNDADASVYPGAPEIKHDGVDQDCNGYDLTIDITRARYVSSQDKLVMWATSDLGKQAQLSATIQLANGSSVNQSLNWSNKNTRWQKVVKNFVSANGSVPVSVTISGVEGAESATVEQR